MELNEPAKYDEKNLILFEKTGKDQDWKTVRVPKAITFNKCQDYFFAEFPMQNVTSTFDLTYRVRHSSQTLNAKKYKINPCAFGLLKKNQGKMITILTPPVEDFSGDFTEYAQDVFIVEATPFIVNPKLGTIDSITEDDLEEFWTKKYATVDFPWTESSLICNVKPKKAEWIKGSIDKDDLLKPKFSDPLLQYLGLKTVIPESVFAPLDEDGEPRLEFMRATVKTMIWAALERNEAKRKSLRSIGYISLLSIGFFACFYFNPPTFMMLNAPEPEEPSYLDMLKRSFLGFLGLFGY